MNEIWKPIPNYEGFYEASDFGRIRSLDRIDRAGRMRKGIVLKKNIRARGYCYVTLQLDGAVKVCREHRLIMLAFCGESSLQVDHINGDASDNRLENLEYVTNRENTRRGKSSDKKPSRICRYRNIRKNKNRFAPEIQVNGKTPWLGSFKTQEEAFQKVLEFEMEHGIE